MKSEHPEHEPHHGASETRRRFLKHALLGAGATVLYPEQLAFSAMRACERSAPTGPAIARPSQPIAVAAESFLSALSADQRSIALFPFEDDRREDWHFIPKQRKGVPYKQLDPKQRRLADALVEAGLGQRGSQKVATIRGLEPILNEIEQGRGPTRDPELYYVSLFGTPQDASPWGLSIEGHHISLNFTMIGADRVASTPIFLGANPAEVRQGVHKGLRALASEEDTARAFLKSLDGEQRARAIVNGSAPGDILSGNARKAEPIQPAGVAVGSLSERQTEIFMRLIEEYAGTMNSAIAAARLAKLRAAGLASIHFAWAGALEHGQPHYYRIQGPTFLVEYDNTQNDANHVHTVWRDFNGDFGEDLLAEHYKDAHK
jgi:hypothetical protein